MMSMLGVSSMVAGLTCIGWDTFLLVAPFLEDFSAGVNRAMFSTMNFVDHVVTLSGSSMDCFCLVSVPLVCWCYAFIYKYIPVFKYFASFGWEFRLFSNLWKINICSPVWFNKTHKALAYYYYNAVCLSVKCRLASNYHFKKHQKLKFSVWLHVV